MSINLGQPHRCSACGKKFYDLGKEDKPCPSCEADQSAPSPSHLVPDKPTRRVTSVPAETLRFTSSEEQCLFEQDFPSVKKELIGIGGVNAQNSGKRNEISVGDILDKGKADFKEQYSLRDVKPYGRGTRILDQLLIRGWHQNDCPSDPNPHLLVPVAAFLESKFQETSGTAYEKIDHSIRNLALCCQHYKVKKARIVLAGKVYTEDLIQYYNAIAIPDTRSCEGLDISCIRIEELWRRMRHNFPL